MIIQDAVTRILGKTPCWLLFSVNVGVANLGFGDEQYVDEQPKLIIGADFDLESCESLDGDLSKKKVFYQAWDFMEKIPNKELESLFSQRHPKLFKLLQTKVNTRNSDLATRDDNDDTGPRLDPVEYVMAVDTYDVLALATKEEVERSGMPVDLFLNRRYLNTELES